MGMFEDNPYYQDNLPPDDDSDSWSPTDNEFSPELTSEHLEDDRVVFEVSMEAFDVVLYQGDEDDVLVSSEQRFDRHDTDDYVMSSRYIDERSDEDFVVRPSLRIPWQEGLVWVLLIATLAGGFYLRSVGRNWDDYTHLHPDERFLAQVISALGSNGLNFEDRRDATSDEQRQACEKRYPAPTAEELGKLSPEKQAEALSQIGKGGYFDAACSNLNPNNLGYGLYVYGEFPIYSTHVIAANMTDLTDNYQWSAYNGIHIVGRAVNSVFDTLTILLIFLITYRIVGRWPALLAAGFYAFAAFPIQQSHFATVDAFTSFWVVLAIYFAVRVADNATDVPERFPMLPWLGMALAMGIWNIIAVGEPSALPFIVYLIAFGLTGILATLGAESQRWDISLTGGLIGLLVIGVATLLQSASFAPAVSVTSLILLGLLVFFWQIGGHRVAAFAGLWSWLAAAFALWVFDSLAFNDTVSLTPLVSYLVLFIGAALLASSLRQMLESSTFQNFTIVLGIPLTLWIVVSVITGESSVEGTLAALVVMFLLGTGTVTGTHDYVGFGIAFGAAMAGRVNTLPVVGVLILAAIVRAIPYMNQRTLQTRSNLIWNILGGLVLAGITSLLVFRVLQPHAFSGPHFWNILKLNPGWQDDIAAARDLVSPKADFPPAHQWGNRIKWIFPLQNIVMYGLGGALGVTAVLSFFWALTRVARGKTNWALLALPVAWVFVYFGWLGQNWVSTMRYFLPIYGMLALLAAWALSELVRKAYLARKANPSLEHSALFGLSSLLLIFVLGYTALYGYGFTSIYRHEMTRVQASRYYQEFIPADIGIWIDKADGDSRLVNINLYPSQNGPEVIQMANGDLQIMQLSPFDTSELLSIELHSLSDPQNDPEAEQLRLQIWAEDAVSGRILLGTEVVNAHLEDADNAFGQAISVTFTDVELDMSPTLGRTYRLELTVVDGGPLLFARNFSNGQGFVFDNFTAHYEEKSTEVLRDQPLNLTLPTAENRFVFYEAGSRTEYNFRANATGTVSRITMPHVADPFADKNDETMRVVLIDEENGTQVSGQITDNFNPVNDGILTFGPSANIELDQPLEVQADKVYKLVVIPDDLLGVTGTIVASEGSWDDPIPYKVCAYPDNVVFGDDNPSGLCEPDSNSPDPYSGFYTGLDMPMSYEDTPDKRQLMLDILDKTDYLAISSNRFYDSFKRIPTRWPMSLRYYDALFAGELGFELIETFESYAQVGPFTWKDEVLPTDNLPEWRNEFEAEEAFRVYDHPTVFIFKKTSDYSKERVEAVLDGTLRRFNDVYGGRNFSEPIPDLLPATVITWSAGDSTQSPTALQMSNEAEDIQKSGGTWSELYNRNAIYNKNQIVGVIVWWLMMVVVGWVTFPLLFWAFAGLPDRGFGIAKLVGWLIVAWVAWFGGSLYLRLWTQNGIWFLLGILALLNGLIAYRQRKKLLAYIRERGDHLLMVEGLSLLLFVFFIGVRLGNPDLWHQSFGGEKPMDFAYLNAVLRSTVFPPIDPWFAGGYINYYYWGFVLVGTPIKALGMVPSFAYNLVIPTLFSFTGVGAFSIGYNLVQWRNERRIHNTTRESGVPLIHERRQPFANAYLAGLLVMLLAIFLGNLDTPRTFVTAVVKSGGWTGQEGIAQEKLTELMAEFELTNGRSPNDQEFLDLQTQANESVSDGETYVQWFSSFNDGFDNILDGQPLPMATHRWYWGPTRVITELPDGKGHGAIAEMPYFTFLYGDLHAHMIAMPLTLIIILFVLSEVMGAGLRLRSPLAAGVAIAIGALAVGVLRATNTWDWPTYMIVGLAGLTFAAWVGQGRITHDQKRIKLFYRIRRTLDLRHVLTLWPLLFVIPIAMLLAGGLYFVHHVSYEANLKAGQIPGQCVDYDANLDNPAINNDTLIEPRDCDGHLKPRFGVLNAIKAGVAGFGAAILLYMAGLIILGNRFGKNGLMDWIGRVLAFVAISVFVVLPFEDSYAVPYNKILPWEEDKTPLWAYLTVHGLFLFIIASLLFWQTARWLGRHKVADLRGLGVPSVLAVAIVPLTLIAAIYASLVNDYSSFIVSLPLLVWLSVLFLLPDQSNIERLVYAAAALALGLTIGVEMVVLDGDIGRQNTVFKFYIQAWLLFSIAGGVGLAWMLHAATRWHFALRGIWQTGLAVLMSVALLYPIMATQARFLDRMDANKTPITLDGMAYMQNASHNELGRNFNLNGDYKMIRWLQDNVQGTPYIIEGVQDQYHWASRIAINTGLPTVMGWNYHQRQQRSIGNLNNMVWNRESNVISFYNTTEIPAAWNLLQFYDVEYVIVGTYERILYKDIIELPDNGGMRVNASPGIRKFDTMVEMGLLEPAYRELVCIDPTIIDIGQCPTDHLSEDIIYRVVDGATLPDNQSVAQAKP